SRDVDAGRVEVADRSNDLETFEPGEVDGPDGRGSNGLGREIGGHGELCALCAERVGHPWRRRSLEGPCTETVEDAVYPLARPDDYRLRSDRRDGGPADGIGGEALVRCLDDGRAGLRRRHGGDLVEVEAAAEDGGPVGHASGVSGETHAVDVARRLESRVGPEGHERVGEG